MSNIPEEHATLVDMINQATYSYGDSGDIGKAISSAAEHLNNSYNSHLEGNHSAAHASLLVSVNHYKKALILADTAKRSVNPALHAVADSLPNSYKHGYELA